MRGAFKIHGGKYYLSPWIISHFPKNYTTYIEPFVGAGNILLNKSPSYLEVIGDVDITIAQVFRALRDDTQEFINRLSSIEYSEETFINATNTHIFTTYIDQAVNEYILRRMSRGGLRKAFAWSDRLRGGQPGDVNAWKTALKLLPTIADRLKNVYIFHKPAVETISPFNDKDTLVYADPPYLHETRVSTNTYAAEMSKNAHVKLAEALNAFRGKVILSGYQSSLYARLFKGWRRVNKMIANHSSQSKKKDMKIESLWLNF